MSAKSADLFQRSRLFAGKPDSESPTSTANASWRFGQPGVPLVLFQRVEEGVGPVATLELWVQPIEGRGRLATAILKRMDTKTAWRRLGYMEQMVRYLQSAMVPVGEQQYALLEMHTSWDDSTRAGRKLCMKCGFRQEGDRLVWRRSEQPVKVETPDALQGVKL